MKFLLVLLFLACSASSLILAQSLDDFTSLRSSGKIPSDFTKRSVEKSKEDYKSNDQKELDKEFFLQTRFFIDELLHSGKVVFNDPISIYIAKVAERVLANHSEVFDKLRFYTIKSSVPNAFSTDQGIIFMTTGLVARFTNEAQMAFVLAHEISHFTKAHVRDTYVQHQTLESDQGKFKRTAYDKILSQISVFKKENELEADAEGIRLMLDGDYDVNEILSCFDILKYCYLPFENIDFKKTYYNNEYLQIPESLFTSHFPEISEKSIKAEESITHPNIEIRIQKTKKILNENPHEGNKKFHFPQDDFEYVRNLARFDLVNSFLSQKDYVDALYAIYILRQNFPNNYFLELSEVKALYGLVKYMNHARYNEACIKPDHMQGPCFRLYEFFYNIHKRDLNVLAFRKTYDLSKRYPKKEIITRYLTDLKKELALRSAIIPEKFRSISKEEILEKFDTLYAPGFIKDSLNKIQFADISEDHKVVLLDSLHMQYEHYLDDSYYLFALRDLVQHDNLIEELNLLKGHTEDSGNGNVKETYSQPKMSVTEGNLGIKKMVVISPVYANYDVRFDQDITKSENKKIQLSELYRADYKKLDLKTEVIDSKLFDSLEVDKYNEQALINDWMMEIILHKDLDIISSVNDQMESVCVKYDTPNFLFSGVFSFRMRHELFESGVAVLFLSTFYLAPLALLDIIFIHHYFEFVAIEVNAKTDKIEFVQINDVNFRDYNRVLKNYVYNVLYKLNTDKK